MVFVLIHSSDLKTNTIRNKNRKFKKYHIFCCLTDSFLLTSVPSTNIKVHENTIFISIFSISMCICIFPLFSCHRTTRIFVYILHIELLSSPCHIRKSLIFLCFLIPYGHLKHKYRSQQKHPAFLKNFSATELSHYRRIYPFRSCHFTHSNIYYIQNIFSVPMQNYKLKR